MYINGHLNQVSSLAKNGTNFTNITGHTSVEGLCKSITHGYQFAYACQVQH